MNVASNQRRFYFLTVFILFFFWDRFIESFFPFLFFGILRPIAIILLWIYIIFKWKQLSLTVSNFNSLIKWFCFIMFLAVLVAIRSIYIGIPPIAIIYTFLQHLGFLPIVLLILSLAESPTHVYKILKVLMLSSVFLSIGVITDYVIGMENIFQMPGVVNMARIDTVGLNRGDFIIGSTNVFVILSVGLIATYLLIFKFTYSNLKAISVFILIGIAMYASGSRASFVFGFFMLIAIFLRFFKNRRHFFTTSLVTFLIGIMFVAFLQIGIIETNTDQLERLQNLASEDAEGNFGRFKAWSRGINMMVDVNSALGYGVGTTNPQTQILFGSPHISDGGFESSIFAMYYEGGIIGLLIFMIPFFTTIIIYKTNIFNMLNMWMFLLYLNFLVSPTAQGYPSNLIIYIALGLCLLFKNHEYRLRSKN